jgi:hypothetical protein
VHDLFQIPIQFDGDRGHDRDLIKVTTSPSGYGPPVPSYSLVVKRHRDEFFIETTKICGDEERSWRTPLNADEVDWYLSRLQGMSVPICSESPTVPDGEYVEITVFGLNTKLTQGWWSVPPAGSEYLGELADWVLRSGTTDDDNDDDSAQRRLIELGNYLKSALMHINRDAIYEEVMRSMINDLKNVCSPSEDEGIENGYDFIGLLKTEGSDHMLYETSMSTLRDDLFLTVKAALIITPPTPVTPPPAPAPGA